MNKYRIIKNNDFYEIQKLTNEFMETKDIMIPIIVSTFKTIAIVDNYENAFDLIYRLEKK